MVTMKDVALKAGVTLTTVSNVIHGKTKRVSESTVARVEAIIRELDYVPNMEARSLAHSRSRIIGVVFMGGDRENPTHLKDPFVSELIDVLEKQIQDLGYFMMLYIASEVAEIIKVSKTWNVEGLVVLFTDDAESMQIQTGIDKPIVFIDCHFDQAEKNFVNVGIDDLSGGYLATRYLLEMGHRRILFVYSGPELKGAGLKRSLGYRRALAEYGLQFQEKNLVPLLSHSRPIDEGWQELFDRRAEYSAIFFDADLIAVEGLNYFQDRGVLIPKDISIIGFDDTVYSTMVRPRLTTIRQNISLKGSLAIQQLTSIIKTGSVQERSIKSPVELIVRDSVQRID